MTSGLCAAAVPCLAIVMAAGCGRLGYEASGFEAEDIDDGGPDDADPALSSDADPTMPSIDAGVTDERPVSAVEGDERRPTLAWTGAAFLLVWDDDRHGDTELYLARLDADGAKATDEVRLTNATTFSGFPAAAWSGSELGVVWEDDRDGPSQIFFARFDESGAPLDGPVKLSNSNGNAYDSALVWNGSEYAAAWDDGGNNQSEVWFTRVDAAGVPIGGPLQRTSAAGLSMRTSIAWSGLDYGLAWEDERAGGVLRMFFTRCDANGTATGGEIEETSSAAAARGASLVWNGSSYGLAWQDARGGNDAIYFSLLDALGNKAAADVQVSAGSAEARQASLVWADDHWAVAYVQDDDVQLAALEPIGTPRGAPQRIGGGETGRAEMPALVWTGASYGLAWADSRSGDWNVYFRQVAAP